MPSDRGGDLIVERGRVTAVDRGERQRALGPRRALVF